MSPIPFIGRRLPIIDGVPKDTKYRVLYPIHVEIDPETSDNGSTSSQNHQNFELIIPYVNERERRSSKLCEVSEKWEANNLTQTSPAFYMLKEISRISRDPYFGNSKLSTVVYIKNSRIQVNATKRWLSAKRELELGLLGLQS